MSLFADIRTSMRSLWRDRALTAVIVATLAVGVGCCTAIVSVADWVIWRSIDFPRDVYVIGGQTPGRAFAAMRMGFMYRAYAEQSTVFSEYALASRFRDNIVTEGLPVGTGWVGVSSNLFDMLGTRMALGRRFLPGEDSAGKDDVVVVSHHFWRNRLNGDQGVIGSQITIGDRICTIIGVLAENQRLPGYLSASVFRPLVYEVNMQQPFRSPIFLLGRLNPNVSVAEAQAALKLVKYDIAPRFQQMFAAEQVVLAPLTELDRNYRPEIYWLLLAAVAFLFLIACLNASNLMLVRLFRMQKSISVRLALGAGRGDIIRLITIDGLLISILAAGFGLLVAYLSFPALLRLIFADNPPNDGAAWGLDLRVTTILILVTLVTAGAISLVPVWRVLRGSISEHLKDDSLATGDSRALVFIRNAMTITQTAAAVVLLCGAGLMMQTFNSFRDLDVGFERAGRAKVYFSFPADLSRDWNVRLAKLKELQGVVRRAPGVQEVAFGEDILLSGSYVAGHQFRAPGGGIVLAASAGLSANYQDAAGELLVRGRWPSVPRGNEVLINEKLARELFAESEPIGRIIQPMPTSGENSAAAPQWQIVGVVRDIRTSMREPAGYWLYFAEGQNPVESNTLIVRHAGSTPSHLAESIQRSIYRYDPRIMVHRVADFHEIGYGDLVEERMATSVLQVLSTAALVLASTGLFSLLAYQVARRQREFGVRLALGATPANLVRLVWVHGTSVTIIGLAVGFAASLILTKYIQFLLFGVKANDSRVVLMVTFLLLATSAAATLIPSLRAGKADVSTLLQAE